MNNLPHLLNLDCDRVTSDCVFYPVYRMGDREAPFIFYAQNDHIYGQKTEEPTLIYKERIILKIDTIWSGNIVADNKRVDFPFIRRIKVLEKIPCHCQTPQWP